MDKRQDPGVRPFLTHGFKECKDGGACVFDNKFAIGEADLNASSGEDSDLQVDITFTGTLLPSSALPHFLLRLV